MAAQKLQWDGNYGLILVVKRDGSPFPHYKVWLHGEKEQELPVKLNNVTFHQDTVTVFEFTGKVFAGKNTLNLKIYEQDNGVVRGEITVVKLT